jgi:hypothetical protein
MRKSFFTIFTIAVVTFSFGQSTFKKNNIYLEAGGNGLFGSINYERQLTKESGLGARIGIGFYSENVFYLTIPVGINYLFKLKNPKSFIDAGLGVTWIMSEGKLFIGKVADVSNDGHIVNFIPSIGYRRHTSKDLMWRISLTPVVNKYNLIPWLGISIGKRF